MTAAGFADCAGLAAEPTIVSLGAFAGLGALGALAGFAALGTLAGLGALAGLADAARLGASDADGFTLGADPLRLRGVGRLL
ncbi:hypothetical protein B5F79_07530 [Olsenella sp. An285]|nr:hypothetical protein B5F79_07530 [Olsenella sp. An285]